MSEKLELVYSAALSARKDPKVFSSSGTICSRPEDQYFASSQGSSIQPYIVRVYPALSATAVDFQSQFNVSSHPAADWIVQQLREALPEAPPCRYAILDHDSKFRGDVIIGIPPGFPPWSDTLCSAFWLQRHCAARLFRRHISSPRMVKIPDPFDARRLTNPAAGVNLPRTTKRTPRFSGSPRRFRTSLKRPETAQSEFTSDRLDAIAASRRLLATAASGNLISRMFALTG